MTQHSGAFTLELNLDQLTEQVAQRTAVLVVSMLRAAPAGADVYHREEDPDPGAGSRQGARFGGVVTDQGDLERD